MIDVQPTRTPDVSLNITPLIDIVFLLLIFFMLTAFFIQPEGLSIKLPTAGGDPVDVKDELVVVIKAKGHILVADRILDLDRLEELVIKAIQKNPDLAVVVKADKRATMQMAVSVMERCKRAGVKRLIIATESPSTTGPKN